MKIIAFIAIAFLSATLPTTEVWAAEPSEVCLRLETEGPLSPIEFYKLEKKSERHSILGSEELADTSSVASLAHYFTEATATAADIRGAIAFIPTGGMTGFFLIDMTDFILFAYYSNENLVMGDQVPLVSDSEDGSCVVKRTHLDNLDYVGDFSTFNDGFYYTHSGADLKSAPYEGRVSEMSVAAEDIETIISVAIPSPTSSDELFNVLTKIKTNWTTNAGDRRGN